MKILVTGGSGVIGRGVVARLLSSGHEVRAIDLRLHDPLPGADYAQTDITNYAGMRDQVRGQDAVIHLAAYVFPGAAPGPEMFRVNCLGTYTVFEAAAAEGIRRVICASSINALGYNFGVKDFPIKYFPIDEDHPTNTTDPYSFSKETTEAIAAYYWRRDGISSTLLRMPFVYTLDDEMNSISKMFLGKIHEFHSMFLTLPEEEQRMRIAHMKAGLETQRVHRVWEKPFDNNFDESGLEDPGMMAFFGSTDFWTILSVEDAAQAFEKSVLADFEGSHPLFVTERENSNGIQTETLLRLFYPEVAARHRPLPGSQSLVSFERARQLIGFEPQYCMRDRLVNL